jgi:hypothetical protein
VPHKRLPGLVPATALGVLIVSQAAGSGYEYSRIRIASVVALNEITQRLHRVILATSTGFAFRRNEVLGHVAAKTIVDEALVKPVLLQRIACFA